MGSNDAAVGNRISQASLEENRRQYNEQQREKDAKKARDKANATANRQGKVFAYEFNQPEGTNVTGGREGNYSLLNANAMATADYAGLMGSAAIGATNKLGG